MAHVLKRALAFADLAEIWSYIADDDEAAADRFLDQVEAKLALLATQPYMGRSRPELKPEIRSFPVGRYVVFFLPMPDGIDVVRVLHSAQDITLTDFLDEGSA